MFKKSDTKGDKKTSGEIFRAALERLSFRSSKKKKKAKYDVKVDATTSQVITKETQPVKELPKEINENTVIGSESPQATTSGSKVNYKPPLPPGRGCQTLI